MIRKFIAIAALCLASSMAFATVAMADPAPDICVLDLSQPVALEHALDTADATCKLFSAVDVAEVVPIAAAGADLAPCSKLIVTANIVDPAGHRQHFDPGRCPT